MLLQSFVSGVTWSVPRIALGKLCSSHVGFHACSGKTLLRDVTGSWNLGDYLMLVLRWDGSVVTLLVLRRYGIYTVFDSRVCYLSQPVLRRDSNGPSFRRWRASFESRKSYKRGSRERAHTQRVVLNCPVFGHRPQAAGPIRASVRGGAPPARLLLQGTFMWRKINFLPMY